MRNDAEGYTRNPAALPSLATARGPLPAKPAMRLALFEPDIPQNTGAMLRLAACLGVGVGFGMTVLAVSILLLNYYGRRNNLELFSMVCLVGAVSALGPVIGGFMRDRLGGFAPTFQIFAAIIGVIFVAALFMRPPRKATEEATAAPIPAPTPVLLRDAA